MGLSPGIYINESDQSQYGSTSATTTFAVVGLATKGPVNVPTLCTSVGSLIGKFGPPLSTDSGLQSALDFLTKGAQVLYVRINAATGPAVAAATNIPGASGAVAAIAATGSVAFVSSNQPTATDTVTISDGVTSKVFEFQTSGGSVTGGNIKVVLGPTSAGTLNNLIAAINTNGQNLNAVNTSVAVPSLEITNTAAGTAGNVAITTSDPTIIQVTGMSGGAASSAGTATNVLTVLAANPGSWGNGIYVSVVSPTTQVGAPTTNFDILVYGPKTPGAPATFLEKFVNLSLSGSSSRFVNLVINQGVPGQNVRSSFIRVNDLVSTPGGSITGGVYYLGQGISPTVGTDGISGVTSSDYIGTVTGQTATGLQSLANKETYVFNLLAVPGVSNGAVINAMLALAEARADCLALIDPPFGLSVSQVCDWVNGNGAGDSIPNSPGTPFNTSYAAVFWPWIQRFDQYNNQTVWVPPSGFMAAAAAATDLNNGPWFPFAGVNRGLILADAIEYSPSQTERDTLQASNVNPLVAFPNTGIVIYGNLTMQRQLSLLNRVHVRRCMLYAESICAAAVKSIQFDPNDSISQKQFVTLVNPLLSYIATQRGFASFYVQCDSSTNPTYLTNQGVLTGQLVCVPNSAAEQIVLDFVITQTTANFTQATS